MGDDKAYRGKQYASPYIFRRSTMKFKEFKIVRVERVNLLSGRSKMTGGVWHVGQHSRNGDFKSVSIGRNEDLKLIPITE